MILLTIIWKKKLVVTVTAVVAIVSVTVGSVNSLSGNLAVICQRVRPAASSNPMSIKIAS